MQPQTEQFVDSSSAFSGQFLDGPPLPPPPATSLRSDLPMGAEEELMTIWISNIAPNTSDVDFDALLSSFGVLSCSHLFKTVSAEGTRNGFAQYASSLEASCALAVIERGNIALS